MKRKRGGTNPYAVSKTTLAELEAMREQLDKTVPNRVRGNGRGPTSNYISDGRRFKNAGKRGGFWPLIAAAVGLGKKRKRKR